MYCMVARDGLLTQMRKGALEYCVLALLGGSEMYGLELVRTLAEVDGMVLSEGTLYPLLSRLRKDDLVDTTWQESASGPPRRYYRLTNKGRRALADFTTEWRRFRDGVDTLLDNGRTGL
jgi:PadR family transcriptional regulator, regulatory protein PadR